MRAGVDGLPNAQPIAELLPSFLQEDGFAVRWTAGLDDVLAPVLAVLDCLDAYVDPLLAPEDFLPWLAEWVGARLDERWDTANRRRTVAAALELHGLRGTLDGIVRDMEVATGGQVEIADGSDVTYTLDPTAEEPDYAPPLLHIRVTVERPEELNLPALERLVVQCKPAHMVHLLEVVPAEPGPDGGGA